MGACGGTHAEAINSKLFQVQMQHKRSAAISRSGPHVPLAEAQVICRPWVTMHFDSRTHRWSCGLSCWLKRWIRNELQEPRAS